jgi:hypothetical protein
MPPIKLVEYPTRCIEDYMYPPAPRNTKHETLAYEKRSCRRVLLLETCIPLIAAPCRARPVSADLYEGTLTLAANVAVFEVIELSAGTFEIGWYRASVHTARTGMQP